MYQLNIPNVITLIRIILVAPFVVCLLHLQDEYWAQWFRWGALGVFAVMSVTDGLDGFLARRWNQQTAVGRLLDPLADKLLIFFSIILLAHEGTHVTGKMLPPEVAVIAIGKDLFVLLGFCIIYFATSKTYVDPRAWGKACMVSQLAMVISILIYPDLPDYLAYLPNFLWWIASFLAVMTAIQYFHLGRLFIIQQGREVPQDDRK
jgi:CDP-diacylglycerol--glycerol-3-phosphate 3-phosphatidyltransferase